VDDSQIEDNTDSQIEDITASSFMDVVKKSYIGYEMSLTSVYK
jgi:hypothetical protein